MVICVGGVRMEEKGRQGWKKTAALAADQRIECGQLADSTISYACKDDM